MIELFKDRLKELREQNGYSMDKLVELYNKTFNAKMNKSTLSRYENGLQEPMYTVVVNLSKLFNVSLEYLSGLEEVNTMNFAERVLELINEKQISKNKLLTDLNLSKNSFVNWIERGTIPGGDVLGKIAEYFDVSFEYLLGLPEANTECASRKDRKEEHIEELSEILSELLDELKKRIILRAEPEGISMLIQGALEIFKTLYL